MYFRVCTYIYIYIYMYVHVISKVCPHQIEVVVKTQLTNPIASICLSEIAVCLVCHNVWPELCRS